GGSGVETVGATPPPTVGTPTIAPLPGTTGTNATGFFFTKLNPASPGEDTLYVADPSVGITRFSLIGGTWVSNGTFGGSNDAFRSLTAIVSGTPANPVVTLYAIDFAAGPR